MPITTLVPAVFNGVIYGFVVWLIYSILFKATGREKKTLDQTIQQNVTIPVKDKEMDVPTETSENKTDKEKEDGTNK